MAHTNSTTNYALPQFLSTDKPAWLTDVNPAYAAIDTGIHNAQVAADAAQGDATQALSDAAAADGKATTADGKGSGAVASLAEAFDPTATYPVGEYVMYNNLLYVCTTAVTTPGPWTGSSNWDRTTLDSIATSVNSRIATLENDMITNSTELPLTALDPTSVYDRFNKVLPQTDIDVTINVPVWAKSDIANRILLYVPFPFLTSTNYNITCSYVNLVGKGIYTSDISLDGKYNGGAFFIITTSATAGDSYVGFATIHVVNS